MPTKKAAKKPAKKTVRRTAKPKAQAKSRKPAHGKDTCFGKCTVCSSPCVLERGHGGNHYCAFHLP